MELHEINADQLAMENNIVFRFKTHKLSDFV